MLKFGSFRTKFRNRMQKRKSKSKLSELEKIAKTQAMKKAAKSGNKQKQKEVNAECDKLEKEQEKRHQQELADDKKPEEVEGAPPADAQNEGPSGNKEANESDEELDSKFYKKVKISSKNAKRQAKNKETEDRMKEAQRRDKEAAERENNAKNMEKIAMKALLTENNLKMVDIPGDGDCLYNALVHQLGLVGHETSTRKLRQKCAKYMKDHEADFKPYVSEADVQDSIGRGTPDYWLTYLKITELCAEVGGCWGGELEAKAISMIYERPIVIFRAESGKYTIGEEFAAPDKQSLKILYFEKAYSLGEHYNSTCPA